MSDPPRLTIRAYTGPARIGAVALQAIALVNLAYLVTHIVYDFLEGAQTAPPLAVAFGLALFSGVPWAGVALVQRAMAGTFHVEDAGGARGVLALRRVRIEIPLSAVAAIRPFALPLPESGLVLVMSSGRRFQLAADEPRALLASLGSVGPAAVSAAERPAVAYADAARSYPRPRAWLLALKWLALPLVLAVILFRLDQYIVFGGAFGQYYAFGLGAYLKSFATYWAGTTAYLAIYASVVRLGVELLGRAITSIAPARAPGVRRLAERVCHLAYFGLVPAYVALRLLL